jgi:hypothetical protein
MAQKYTSILHVSDLQTVFLALPKTPTCHRPSTPLLFPHPSTPKIPSLLSILVKINHQNDVFNDLQNSVHTYQNPHSDSMYTEKTNNNRRRGGGMIMIVMPEKKNETEEGKRMSPHLSPSLTSHSTSIYKYSQPPNRQCS